MRNCKPNLSKLEECLVNLFTPLDAFLEFSKMKYLFMNKESTEYYGYFKKSNPQNLYEKVNVIWEAKIDKTRKLIRSKYRNEGVIPERIENVSRKTPCGKIRYFIANRHYTKDEEKLIHNEGYAK